MGEFAVNLNVLEHIGLDLETACRWAVTFNQWEWPEDFPVPEPEGWDSLDDREKYKSHLFQIFSLGIDSLITKKEFLRFAHTKQDGKSNELFEQWWEHQNDREWCIRNYYGYSPEKQEEIIALMKAGEVAP